MRRPDSRRRGQRPRLEALETRELRASESLAGPAEWMRLRAGYQDGARLYPETGHDLLVPADFDGDGKADPAVFRPSTSQFFVLGADGVARADTMGEPYRSLPVVGDYDGDGRADEVVFNVRDARWTGRLSGGGGLDVQLGAPNLQNIPVPADFDGDGRTDPAVYSPSEGLWRILYSGGGVAGIALGRPNVDVPAPADFDGDGKADPAVYQYDTGQWLIGRSRDGPIALALGRPGPDVPAPADFDGDGKADPAVFQPDRSGWEVLGSRRGVMRLRLGNAGLDVPAPADYDGDGRTDPAVTRPDTPTWRIRRSRGGLMLRDLDPAATPFALPWDSWTSQHVVNAARNVNTGGPVDLVFFGDSITYHFGDSDRIDTGSDAWRGLVGSHTAVNFSIPSDVTQGLLWRINHGEMPDRPKAAVVAIGTNNLGPDLGQSPEDTARGVAAIVRSIRRRSPSTKVLVMGVFPRGFEADDPIREEIRQLNARLARVARGRNVVFLDIGSHFLQPDGSISRDVMGDGLHPTALGYEIWANAIRDRLNRLLA
jgi:lysophospholipase L1-like esterase